MSRLVVVSNRVADPDAGNRGSVGGLAVGVLAAMEKEGGLWFGWNGEIEDASDTEASRLTSGKIDYVTVGLTEEEYDQYYKGFTNSVIWPLFHQRPELMKYRGDDYQGYLRVNHKFAEGLVSFLKPDDVIWIHDYHLIPLGEILREKGVTNPIGFFLHTPFPPLDLLRALPGHRKVLQALFTYDLIGFQTQTDLRAFREGVIHSLGGQIAGDGICYVNDQACLAAVYPIGIETDSVPRFVDDGKNAEEFIKLRSGLGDRKLIIGVDRLDYSKGLGHRFLAYERLLKYREDLHRKIVLLQVAPTSRSDVEAYSDLADSIDRAAGHVIGTFADFDWMPLRYINRGFERNTILAMYNLARVGFVTPLRDGMNLVAKEFVAAQNPEDPGVLVLSKMAGAAAELRSAVIVNPYDLDNVAKQLAAALEMPLDERKDRWKKMIEVLDKNNIHNWNTRFIRDLTEIHESGKTNR